MIDYLFVIAVSAGAALTIFWIVRRDRKTASHWGDQKGQSSILTGAQSDAPQFYPIEPVPGLSVNGSPVDELSHEASFNSVDEAK